MSELKERASAYLDNNCQQFFQLGNDLFHTPELGFREFRTSRQVGDYLNRLGLDDLTTHAVTGLKGRLRGRNSIISVGIIGELDAIYCPDHPAADKETGAVHACGHHMQLVAMLAAAEALVKTGAARELDGDVVFLATPAEEYIDSAFRKHLLESGQVRYASGKQEMLAVGCFDDVDLALSTHAMANSKQDQETAFLCTSCNGFDSFRFEFIGKGGHAGIDPGSGVNALNAAVLSIAGIQALRDTFPDREFIRVSFILTEGGNVLNIIPDKAVLEVQIRGRTTKAIEDVKAKVGRAVRGGAGVIGCQLLEQALPGYKPYLASTLLSEIYGLNAQEILGGKPVKTLEHGYQCTDLGDLSAQIPVAQLVTGGFGGRLHGKDFCVADAYQAYILPAKIICATVIDLLEKGAAKARKVKEEYEKDER